MTTYEAQCLAGRRGADVDDCCPVQTHLGMAFHQCETCGVRLCEECDPLTCEACPSDRKYCANCIERVDVDSLPCCEKHAPEVRAELEREFGKGRAA